MYNRIDPVFFVLLFVFTITYDEHQIKKENILSYSSRENGRKKYVGVMLTLVALFITWVPLKRVILKLF
jgi:hypothetical protein